MQEVATDKVQGVLKEVSENHEINIEELTGPSKRADIVLARKDAYKKLEQAGFGPSEIGRALNRSPSTVTRGLVEPTKKCPKGHGPLRRDDREGYLVCPIFCGYEEPLEELPALDDPDPGNGKYADKSIKPEGYEQRRVFHYPEATKIQAVKDVEGGADKEEVCKRVGCHFLTLDAWIAKYGEKSRVEASIKALKILLRELGSQRFNLLDEASILNSRIEAVKEAIKILEEK